jgi:hypothetical protein
VTAKTVPHLTSQQAQAQGWTVTRSLTGLPRFQDPEGRLYAPVGPNGVADVVIAGYPLRWCLHTGALLRAMKAVHFSERGPA